MNIRICALSVLIAVVLLCFHATPVFAVTIVPINGDKKIYDPGPTPYWQLGEPGPDPYWRTGEVFHSGSNTCRLDEDQRENAAACDNSEFIAILKIILFNRNISIFRYSSHSNSWSN